MRIVYVSVCLPPERFLELFPDLSVAPGQQVQKYHRLMIAGLIANGVDVVALTAPPVRSASNRLLVTKLADENSLGIRFVYLPVLGIRLLKHLATFLSSFIQAVALFTRDHREGVICDVLTMSAAAGALLASKVCRRFSMAIVTDLPQHLPGRWNYIRTQLSRILVDRYDSYIVLTPAMNGVVNRSHAPHLVIEGQVDSEMVLRPRPALGKSATRVCLYAGGINRIYGIPILVQGFLSADVPDLELHVYGAGDYAEELTEIASGHPSVRYFGVVSNEEVVEAELRASLLVNPRPTNEEYTLYSFPSKNLEYMSTGTPVLTTRLPGMPEEYYPHVFLVEDESAEGIASALRRIFAMSDRDLERKGDLAKSFVMGRKSNLTQAAKVAGLLQSIAPASRAPKRRVRLCGLFGIRLGFRGGSQAPR